MPANLTPQYQMAEDAFKAAQTDEARLAALEQMLACIPKHKGTEKLQADLKKRISKLKAVILEEGRKKSGKVDPYRFPKEAAAQAFVIGPVNSGKSSIVGWLTGAKVVVAEYPFATTAPVSGMARYEDVQVQLIDTPPVVIDEPVSVLFANARLADAVLVVIDASQDSAAEDLDSIMRLLRTKKVLVDEPDASGAGLTKDRILIIGNKADLEGAEENLPLVGELLPELRIHRASALTGEGLAELPKLIFKLAGAIRVYAKPPGGKLERKEPFVVKRGSTVEDVAGTIHKELKHSFKNARLWGSAKFSGQSVPRDYKVEDGDIIEYS